MAVMPLADYARAVIDHVDQRRGCQRTTSSHDWNLLRTWQATIPLPIVIEAADSCFNYLIRACRERSDIGLRYIAPAVEELWNERRDLYAGALVADADGQQR